MPNRIIKESICTSDNIDMLSAFQETVFYRMLVNCDDYGRMDARPKILASKLFPLRDIRAGQMEDALRALTSAELVILYDVGGKPFLQMKTWDRHQQIRAKKSKYPAPADGIPVHDSTCNQMISDDSKCPRNPIQSESNTILFEEERKGEHEGAAPDGAPAPPDQPVLSREKREAQILHFAQSVSSYVRMGFDPSFLYRLAAGEGIAREEIERAIDTLKRPG